jgi:hypothetical protein
LLNLSSLLIEDTVDFYWKPSENQRTSERSFSSSAIFSSIIPKQSGEDGIETEDRYIDEGSERI